MTDSYNHDFPGCFQVLAALVWDYIKVEIEKMRLSVGWQDRKSIRNDYDIP